MELKEGYKQTEVGVIPRDWEAKKLGEIAIVATGNTPPTQDQANYGSDYFFVSPADLGKGKYITDTEKKLSEKGFEISRRFPKNSILFTCIGSTIGKSGIAPKELTSNQQINAVFPSDNFCTDYLFYALSLLSVKIKLLAGEQAVPIINKTEFGQTLIPLPPTKAEQTAIATALSDADALIQSLEKLIAKKRLIKQGAMQELLKPKEGWMVKKLGEICEINMGQSPSSSNYNASGVGLPLVQGNADIADRKTIIRNYTSQITKRCNNGDIIMSVRAPVGEIALATFDACIGRGVCAISYPNAFLYHYLIFIEPQWAKHSTGSTFDSVNSDTIWALEINTPPPPEQTRIATILADMDAEISAIETNLAKYKLIKQGMMQELLTGRTRLV